MAKEIERRFLVTDIEGFFEDAKAGHKKLVAIQGYLSVSKESTVRIRSNSGKWYLAIKGPTIGISRDEFEYQVPEEDGQAILKMCENRLIEKVRYKLQRGKHVWEVDIFGGHNNGLITAEVELLSADEEVTLPYWIGEEISHDERYYNALLAVNPFTEWSN